MSIANFLYYLKNNNITNFQCNPLYDFSEFCVRYIKNTKSQNFQDIFALWATTTPSIVGNNFFVEFGATNGIDGSNTYLLEKDFNWKGILAEPIPEYFQHCVRNRSNSTCFPFAVSDVSDKKVEFVITDEMDLSTLKSHQMDSDEHVLKRQNVKETISIETITLYDLLERGNAPKNINYISVDTEGSEYEILEKFFLENKKYEVGCFTVEHNWDRTKMGNLIRLFGENGYHMVFPEISRWDFFFIHDKHYKELFNDTK